MTREIKYRYPMYTDSITDGFLTYDRRTHACFHYYLMCQKLLEKAGHTTEDQIRYEGELWWDKPYGNIAKSTALIYQLESPAEFLDLDIKRLVENEVQRLGFPSPAEEYWNVEPGKIVTV